MTTHPPRTANVICEPPLRSPPPLYKLETLDKEPLHGFYYKEDLVAVDVPINSEIKKQRTKGTRIEIFVNGDWHSLEEYVIKKKK